MSDVSEINNYTNEIQIDGMRFPKVINNVWEVSKVLNQKKGKLTLKELRASKVLSSQQKVNSLQIEFKCKL